MLISKGGVELGLDVTEIPLDENRIVRNLEVGHDPDQKPVGLFSGTEMPERKWVTTSFFRILKFRAPPQL